MSDYWQQIINLAKQSGALDVRITYNSKTINVLAKKLNILEKTMRKHTSISGFKQDAQWADADGLADRITALEKQCQEFHLRLCDLERE